MSEWGEGPETCGTTKICKYCEFCTCDYTTSKHYCLNVSPLRITFMGPRPVMPTNTCKHFTLCKKIVGYSR